MSQLGAPQLRTAAPCSLSPWERAGVEIVRLEVDGALSELRASRAHAEWLRGYADEDALVQIVETDLA